MRTPYRRSEATQPAITSSRLSVSTSRAYSRVSISSSVVSASGSGMRTASKSRLPRCAMSV